ncbi:hypothetical protein, partial [Sphingosinicella sp. CPCC 101087]|uniref:hypothetical protein n=1 Tax=Sphingosinicella sp. CPCC 101087 TaxID=2497754 RepID=UPI0019819459
MKVVKPLLASTCSRSAFALGSILLATTAAARQDERAPTEGPAQSAPAASGQATVPFLQPPSPAEPTRTIRSVTVSGNQR